MTAPRDLATLGNLAGRVALVTGAAGHVGRLAVNTLLEAGARVALTDRDPEACARLAAQAPDRAWAVPADLADDQQAREAVRTTVTKAGGLDILVHAAAFVGTTERQGWAVPFAQQSTDAWRDAMQVNLTSAFAMAQEGESALAASGHGSVVFVGSIYGVVGPDLSLYADTTMANPAAYGASKGGLLQLTRYLATVLAPRVRVNMISPGGIWRNQPDAFVTRYVSRTPLGRMATEEDLKGALYFFAGDLSAYVTGQHLVIDGGWTAW